MIWKVIFLMYEVDRMDEKFLIWLLLKNILFDMSKQEQYGVHVYIFRFPEHILPTLVCMFIHG